MSNDTKITIQAAANLLGCSPAHLINLLKMGEITYFKVSGRRKVKLKDVIDYKKKKAEQQALLIKIMQADEASGLYQA